MSDEYWEDRITQDQHNACTKALEKFRKSRKNRDAKDDLYAVLTLNGVLGEEADEIINLELQ